MASRRNQKSEKINIIKHDTTRRDKLFVYISVWSNLHVDHRQQTTKTVVWIERRESFVLSLCVCLSLYVTTWQCQQVLSRRHDSTGLAACSFTSSVVELVRNLVAHGDAREGKWRGNWRMEWVASTLRPPPNVVYPALLKLMRTPRLPAVDWTNALTYLNGLVRFGERRNLVSARVPSRSARAITVTSAKTLWRHRGQICVHKVRTFVIARLGMDHTVDKGFASCMETSQL